MTNKYLTKSGSMMDNITRSKIIKVMTDIKNDGLTQTQISKKCDISTSTLKNYLTEQTWSDIRKLRLAIVAESLSKVDQAIFAKAINGDLSAAKLVYSRWDDQQKQNNEFNETNNQKTIEQIDDEIKQIKRELKQYQA